MWLPPHYTGMLTLICRKILTALIYAATGGYESIVNALLKHGANPNLQDLYSSNNRMTALMYAARDGYSTIVNNLLKSGANPNFRLIRDGLHLCMQQKRLFRHCLFPTDKWC